MSSDVIICIVLGCFSSLMVGIAIGAFCENSDWKHRMVKKGRAEYYLDKNNQRQWRWKPASDGE